MSRRQSGTVIKVGKRQPSSIQSVRQKIVRLQTGAKPRVLDLFAGCGGLSLGFQAAGYEIAAAIEFDKDAARSHGTNFHPEDARHAEARDITTTPPRKLTEALGLGEPEASFDIVVGGPPCQAFARVGRSKLREVADHPEAFRHDPRSRLYIEYIEYVKACTPLAVVLENVPDMLNFAGHNIAHEICEVLSGIGYTCSYTLLNAAMYGVPQMRERAFLVAIHREITGTIKFPKPTHKVILPPGYEGTRAVALKLLADTDTLSPGNFWKPTPEADTDVPQAVTVRQALEDLPIINAQAELESGRLKRGARRFDIPVPYQHTVNISDYARLMREWPGMSAPDMLGDHVIRYLPRDYKLFARLSPGDQYPEAYRMAAVMFEEKLVQRRAAGDVIEEGSDAWLVSGDTSNCPPGDRRTCPP